MIITSQEEWESWALIGAQLPTNILINTSLPIKITTIHRNIYVTVGGWSVVEFVPPRNEKKIIIATDNSTVYCRGGGEIIAHKRAHIEAYDKSIIWAHDESSVFAFNNSFIKGYDSSTTMAHNSCQVTLYGKAALTAGMDIKDKVVVKVFGSGKVKATNNTKVLSGNFKGSFSGVTIPWNRSVPSM